MKLTLFTWIPVSSTGMTILLFAAQLNAAGVCIICPPGYECAAGSAPVLGGNAGQILRRTAAGTEWVDVAAIQGAQGPQGAQGAQGEVGPMGMTGPEGASWPAPGAGWANRVPIANAAGTVHWGHLPFSHSIMMTSLAGWGGRCAFRGWAGITAIEGACTDGTMPSGSGHNSGSFCWCRFAASTGSYSFMPRGLGNCPASGWVRLQTTPLDHCNYSACHSACVSRTGHGSWSMQESLWFI